MRKIDPEYSFRFTIPQILSSYASLEAALAAGDYNLVAAYSQDPDQRGIAQILTGLPQQGLKLLEGLPPGDARRDVARAVADWSLGRREACLEKLDSVGGDDAWGRVAADLAAAIRRPRLNVFILGVLPGANMAVESDLSHPQFQAGSFHCSNVGTALPKNAWDSGPATSITELVESLPAAERPDFTLTLGSQWFPIRDLERLAVPKLIWHNDFDILYWRAPENFALFDVNIVTTTQEHFEIGSLLGRPIFTHFMAEPFSMPFQAPQPPQEKTHDFFFSGRALEPFENDRSRFLFKISQLPDDYAITIVEGHLDYEDYRAGLQGSRFMPVLSRYAGMQSPRWREALSKSVFLLCPEGTAYDQVIGGSFGYRAETLAADVARHIDHARAGAPEYDADAVFQQAQELFAIHREPQIARFERLLQFCLLASIMAKHGLGTRADASPRPVERPRLLWSMPIVDCSYYGFAAILDKIGPLLRAWRSIKPRDDKDYANLANLYNGLAAITGLAAETGVVARDEDVVFLGKTLTQQSFRSSLANEADRVLTEGLKAYPKSLLLHFNAIYWRHRGAGSKDVELEAKLKWLAEEAEQLDFDPLGSDLAGMAIHWTDRSISYFDYADGLIATQVSRSTGIDGNRPPQQSKRTVRGMAAAMLADHLERKGKYLDALGFADLAADLFDTNWKILSLRFEIYLQYLGREDGGEEMIQRSIDALYAAINRFPPYLLWRLPEALLVLDAAGAHEEARELVDIWYRFAKRIHREKVGQPHTTDMIYYEKLCYKFHLFPQYLQDKMRSWSRFTIEEAKKNLEHIDISLFAEYVRSEIATAKKWKKREFYAPRTYTDTVIENRERWGVQNRYFL